MMKMIVLGLAAMAALVAAPASAQSSYSTFENAVPAGSPSSPGFVTVPSADGWTGGPNGIELQYGGVAGAPASNGGNVFVELDTSRNSYMQRPLTAGNYVLGFSYSPRPGVPAGSNGISLSIVDINTNAVSSIFDIALTGLSSTAWQVYSVNFNVVAGQAIRFSAIGTSDGVGGYIDNINISAVPESATWAMMLLGFGGIGFAIRRKKAGAPIRFA